MNIGSYEYKHRTKKLLEKYIPLMRITDKHEVYKGNKLNPLLYVLYDIRKIGKYYIIDLSESNGISIVLKPKSQPIVVQGYIMEIVETLLSTIIVTGEKAESSRYTMNVLGTYLEMYKYVLKKNLQSRWFRFLYQYKLYGYAKVMLDSKRLMERNRGIRRRLYM